MLSSIPCGDLELNVGHPHGTPTLVPSIGLEQRLDIRLIPRPRTPENETRLAIHLHVFYLDTLEALLRPLIACKQGLGDFDLWISTDSSSKAAALTQAIQQSSLMEKIQALEVKVCANRGRNLGPLLLDLWPQLKSYNLLLHLHGKRSVETDLGSNWLEELLSTLLPNAATVADLRERFSLNPSLGLVMPQAPEVIRPYLNWGNNFELARQLTRAWHTTPLSREAVLLFPAGMMFWCRPNSLEPLAELVSTLGELPPEPLAVDGTSLHALERLVAHSCEAAQLQWRLLCKQEPTTQNEIAADLSIWDVQQDMYLQACSLLAARARTENEQRLCAESNLANCTLQLKELLASAEQQTRDLMAAVEERDQRLLSLQTSLSWRLTTPLRVVDRLARRRRSSS